jgi:hypothetical protein
VKIKEYVFVPDPDTLAANRSIKFLNQRTLKCLEDAKDYIKVPSTTPLGLGRYCLRLRIRNIKNNGLMVGICSLAAKQSIGSIKFNDLSTISINSCGYVVNKGVMSPFAGRMKTGDVVRMVVSPSIGDVRWFCNDIEVAVAEMGPLSQ